MQLSSGQPMAARAGARFGRQANFRSEQRPANTCSAQSMQSQHSAQRAQQQQQQASLHHHHNSQQHHYARAQPCARAPASGQLEQVNLQPQQQQFQLGQYRADTAPVGAHYSQQQHYDHHYEQQLAQCDALMPAAGAQTTTPCHLTSPSPPPPPSYLMQTSPQQQQQQQQQHHQWPAATSLIYAPATCPAQQQQQQQPPQPAPEGAPPGFATRQASPASSYLASPSPCNAQLAPGRLTPPGQSRQAATAPVVVAAPLGGRLASPSGASSTISSSESLANMSINLEQYISKRNERERSRVRNVNDAFDNLKSSLPLETDRLSKRMSKVEILRTAIGYIKNLEEVLGYKHLQQQQQQLERAGAGSPTAGGASFKRARSGSAGHLMRSSQQVGRLLMAQSHELRGAAARNNDCELGAWRQQRRDALAARPASSLSGQDLSRLEDGASCAGGAGGDSFAPMSKILKRELDAHNKMAAAAAAAAASAQPQARNEADNMECDSNQLVSYIQQQQQQLLLPASGQGGQGGGGGQQTTMATNCRQDTFRGEQTSVEEFRRRQQRHQQQHHQGDQETGGELLAQHERLAQAGFEEFNANVRCYNAAANFDHYY